MCECFSNYHRSLHSSNTYITNNDKSTTENAKAATLMTPSPALRFPHCCCFDSVHFSSVQFVSFVTKRRAFVVPRVRKISSSDVNTAPECKCLNSAPPWTFTRRPSSVHRPLEARRKLSRAIVLLANKCECHSSRTHIPCVHMCGVVVPSVYLYMYTHSV